MASKRRAHTEMKRIARSKHADLEAALGQHGFHRGIEGRRPWHGPAGDCARGVMQMPVPAEDHVGFGDKPACGFAETRQAILADADDGKPFLR
ncbi:hypothetical protein GCM10011385_36940 [Nitratireductor aestuarii]|uniref:Uncharacterized protein n=1 Tax=Nitratireductor aestuarii TaxID=1735103 RepID=A0A916W9L1_9HYPH|nr:hypothetical protein GCM10011385_36940 [Nitratireductor aestuarii]